MTNPGAPSKLSVTSELPLRIASALVLGSAALTLTWAGLWPFAALVMAVTLIVLWEWGHVVRNAPVDGAFYASAAMLAAVIGLAAILQSAIGLALLAGGAVAVALLRRRSDGRLSALGLLYAGSAGLALVWLRSGRVHGLEAIVLLFLVVWGADSGAYAAGRTIGGPKLWPAISPNKTWAGLIGALLAGSVIACGFAIGVTHGNAMRATLIGAALALVSQGGDLVESAIKRRHGVKDASHLIPGHGGFMDRVDGLIFAAVAAALYAAAVGSGEPAEVLLALD